MKLNNLKIIEFCIPDLWSFVDCPAEWNVLPRSPANAFNLMFDDDVCSAVPSSSLFLLEMAPNTDWLLVGVPRAGGEIRFC